MNLFPSCSATSVLFALILAGNSKWDGHDRKNSKPTAEIIWSDVIENITIIIVLSNFMDYDYTLFL